MTLLEKYDFPAISSKRWKAENTQQTIDSIGFCGWRCWKRMARFPANMLIKPLILLGFLRVRKLLELLENRPFPARKVSKPLILLGFVGVENLLELLERENAGGYFYD